MSGEVRIGLADGSLLAADLGVPDGPAPGMVVFAHGSGSSRHSPRNRAVAAALRARGLGTLLADLLTPEEDRVDAVTREHRFDIPLLAGRVVDVVRWVIGDRPGPIGLFGASTGAAAALIAAARIPEVVTAVVSRGGRTDLAGDAVAEVRAPTRLIVGERDGTVLDINGRTMQRLRCEASLEVVAGAGHLFEEPGALEEVARLAGDWFVEWISPGASG